MNTQMKPDIAKKILSNIIFFKECLLQEKVMSETTVADLVVPVPVRSDSVPKTIADSYKCWPTRKIINRQLFIYLFIYLIYLFVSFLFKATGTEI